MKTSTASPTVDGTTITSLDAALSKKLTRLAAPLLAPKGFKDPRVIAEIFRLAQEHGLSHAELATVTGLSGKTVRMYAQARTSSDRHFPALRKEMKAAGVEVQARRGSAEARLKSAERKTAQKAQATALMTETKPQPIARPAPAPVASAPHTPPAPAPTSKTVEIKDDGSITLVLRPGDPGYAETLRSLLIRAA